MAADHTTKSFEGLKLCFGVAPMVIGVVAALLMSCARKQERHLRPWHLPLLFIESF